MLPRSSASDRLRFTSSNVGYFSHHSANVNGLALPSFGFAGARLSRSKSSFLLFLFPPGSSPLGVDTLLVQPVFFVGREHALPRAIFLATHLEKEFAALRALPDARRCFGVHEEVDHPLQKHVARLAHRVQDPTG